MYRWESLGSAVISFEALAENNVSDITLILREGDTKIASSSIGNVTAGSTKSKKLPFYIDKEGKHEVEMLLQYDDQLGQTQEVSLGKWTVNVTQASTKSNTANIDQIMSSDEFQCKHKSYCNIRSEWCCNSGYLYSDCCFIAQTQIGDCL